MVKMMVVRDGMKGVLVEMLALLLMVMIEIIIEGEAGGLALGCVRCKGLDISLVVGFQGSPRKEKMIWICFGERILRGRE